MFQEFFTDTIMSRFIKYLLQSVKLPTLRLIDDDAEMVAGVKYIYKNYIIECQRAGRFKVLEPDDLYPSNNIYPSIALYPHRGYMLGTYKVLDYYNVDNFQLHYTFRSKNLYYDPETHYYLGEYLRYFKHQYHINLLPYYNCYNGTTINNIVLDRSAPQHYVARTDPNKKLIAIPVKFGKIYTIAIDSTAPVELRSMVYHQSLGNIFANYSAGTYFSDMIDDYEFISNTKFDKPFIKAIPFPTTDELYNQEKNLYLTIQLPITNNSSIVVLEGDYTNSWKTQITDIPKTFEHNEIIINPSLLHFNCNTSFAFSDRLIEYLLLAAINPTEAIPDNIAYLNDLIKTQDFKSFYSEKLEKNEVFKHLWNDEIREYIIDYIRTKYNKPGSKLLRDQDGYLNIDLERIFAVGGLN